MDREEVLHHLGYEWWMFRAAGDLLQATTSDVDPVRNALIECLVLHGRVLRDFFYREKARRDDVSIEDLGLSRGALPGEVRQWGEAADKRLAHITLQRSSSIVWDSSAIRRHFEQEIDRVRGASVELSAEWVGNRPTESRYLQPGPTGSADPPVGPTGATGPARA